MIAAKANNGNVIDVMPEEPKLPKSNIDANAEFTEAELAELVPEDATKQPF